MVIVLGLYRLLESLIFLIGFSLLFLHAGSSKEESSGLDTDLLLL